MMLYPTDYINSFDLNIKNKLNTINNLLVDLFPGIEVSIKYDMLYYTLNDKYLYVGAFKKHIGLYGFKETILNIKSNIKSLNGTYYLFNNDVLDINELAKIFKYQLK